MKNEIIAELRRIRDMRAQRHNRDIEAMACDLTELRPWMKKKTYVKRNGRMVTVASLRRAEARRRPVRKAGTRKKENGVRH